MLAQEDNIAQDTEAPLGVLLLQLGGPDELDQIEPFLAQMLADPALVQLPFFLRPWQNRLARRWAAKRTPKVRERYSLIGGGSPLVATTNSLARTLEKHLNDQFVAGSKVLPFYRYGDRPLEEVLEELGATGINRLMVLSLYPHFSHATTGSSLGQLEHLPGLQGQWPEPLILRAWYDHEAYLELLADQVLEHLGEDSLHDEQYLKETVLLCSAHGLPRRYVAKGDPYRDQVMVTFEALRARLDPLKCQLGFQSDLGPVEWIRPFSSELIPELYEQGCRRLLVMPLGFVCDHIETLYDMDVVLKRTAHEAGINEFHRLPAFNDGQPFVELLTRMIMELNQQKTGGDLGG